MPVCLKFTDFQQCTWQRPTSCCTTIRARAANKRCCTLSCGSYTTDCGNLSSSGYPPTYNLPGNDPPIFTIMV